MNDRVLLNLLNKLRKGSKSEACQAFYRKKFNKGMSYCYAIHESPTGLKETSLPTAHPWYR